MKAALLAICLLALAPAPARSAEMPLDAWRSLPVLHNGRVMPMDTFARNVLLSLSGKSTFDRKPAALWLARTLFTPDACGDDAIFLINHPEVVEALGLQAEGRARYTPRQLQPAMAELSRLARAASRVEEAARSPVETELLSVFENLDLYNSLCQSFDFAAPQPDLRLTDPQLLKDLDLREGAEPTLVDLTERRDRIAALMSSQPDVPPEARTRYQSELAMAALGLRMRARQRSDLPPAMIPPRDNSVAMWLGPGDALSLPAHREELLTLCRIASAFRAGDAARFDLACADLLPQVSPRVAKPQKLAMEVAFNRADAFYRSEILYGLGFLLTLVSIPLRNRWAARVAAALVGLALLPHTYGIVARMVIMDRPPVTNLYSTFVFVAWMSAVLGLAMEYFQRNRLGLLTAATCGLALLLTAGRFGEDGDTMGVMVAVLDSNFWLATHVVTISMGYAGCCVSGLLAHVYLAQALHREPSDAGLRETFRAVYGAQAFGLIFSFVGTMLGGVWADQSWGRFWGWDPKENGALVIVLWSAILFHARLGRMIGPRGFAAGSIFGIIAVLLAWLGVNLLGVGLHSYGFTSGVARGLMIACGAEVLFVIATAPFSRRAAAPPP